MAKIVMKAKAVVGPISKAALGHGYAVGLGRKTTKKAIKGQKVIKTITKPKQRAKYVRQSAKMTNEQWKKSQTGLDAKWPDEETEIARYMEAARAQELSGVDMLWLENMKDLHHAPRAVRAAASSGLPVVLGISARTDEATGELVMWGNGVDAVPFTTDWFNNLCHILGPSLVGVNVMYTDFSTMASTLKFVREICGWKGPLGAYPCHGRFEAPNWKFAELDTEEALEHVDSWIRDYDVQMVGGDCGLGPEYIAALSAHVRRHNASLRSCKGG